MLLTAEGNSCQQLRGGSYSYVHKGKAANYLKMNDYSYIANTQFAQLFLRQTNPAIILW